MNKQRMLVALVVTDVFLAFSVIGAELFFQWTLPGSLRDYGHSRPFPPSSLWDLWILGLWATTVMSTVVAWVGLVNLWWFARRLYVFAWATWILLTLVSGPAVLTPVGAMFDTVESVVGGLILGLVYFSDLSRAFERPVARVPATA